MPNKSISLSGEVHISTEQVYTTVDALEALKAIGLAYGLYSRAEELRGQRVHLTGDEGHTALVVQEDFSCHGSPCWETVRTLTEDPAEIQQYMASSLNTGKISWLKLSRLFRFAILYCMASS